MSRHTPRRRTRRTPTGPWWRSPVAHLVVALLLAAGAGVGAGILADHHQRARVSAYEDRPDLPPPGDRVAAAIAELRADGVHVADEARDQLSVDDERALEQLIARQQVAVGVIVWPASNSAGGTTLVVEDQVQQALGEERMIVVVWDRPAGRGEVFATGGPTSYPSRPELVGEAATTLPAVVRAAQDVEWREPSSGSENDTWGGPGGGVTAGIFLGLCVAGGLALAVALARRALGRHHRLPGSWRDRVGA